MIYIKLDQIFIFQIIRLEKLNENNYFNITNIIKINKWEEKRVTKSKIFFKRNIDF